MKKIILLMSLLFLMACGGKSEKASSSKEEGNEATKRVLRLAWKSDIKQTDPSHAYDGATKDLLANTMEGLFMLDERDQPVPALVESYEYDSENLTYTFKIKEGIKWFKVVDGKPVETGDVVDANDFEYSWKRKADPKTASQQAQFLAYAAIKNYGDILNGEKTYNELGIKAIDKYTLQVELEKSVPYFFSLMAIPSFYPISEEFVKEVEASGKTFGTSVETTLNTAAFIMTEWRTDEGMKFVKNNDYWDVSGVEVDEVEITINKDSASSRNLFESGYINKIELASRDAANYKGRDGFRTTLGSAVSSLKFNVTKDVASNRNLRKAISNAVNRTPYVDVVLNNGSIEAQGIIPKGFSISPSDVDFREGYKGVGYNLEEAKKYFELAKAEMGDSITIELLLTDSQGDKKNGEFLQSELERNLPGLTVNLKQVPFKNRLSLENNGEYEMVLCTYGLNYVDPMALLELWTSDSSINNAFYNSPKYDGLVAAAKSEKDLGARWQLMLDAEKVFVEEDAIKIPIVQGAKTFIVSDDIENYLINKTAYADVWKAVTYKK